jgi:hypothetical protein
VLAGRALWPRMWAWRMFGGVVGVVVAVRGVDVWVKWTTAQGAAWWAAAVGLVAAGKVVWAVEELLWV